MVLRAPMDTNQGHLNIIIQCRDYFHKTATPNTEHHLKMAK